MYSYYQGRDINERIHQQDQNFRSFVTRELEPGGVYYLRVEANQPAYELELRLVKPAPYKDPRRALRHAVYYHLAEVDALLIHRPRNIALHRRVRDGTSLFGENWMSCHTQAGVWGVAEAFGNGYWPDGTVQNWRRLVNTMYESLRPTVKLKDGAVNTSLPPNDLGDGPAGSRVAGRNIVLYERAFRPKKLHATSSAGRPTMSSRPLTLRASTLHGGDVALTINGKTILAQMDGYRPEQTPTGPVSLGVYQFREGKNLLTIRMLGAHPDAEPLYIFGLDYVATVPDEARASLLTENEQGIKVVDPLTQTKHQIIEMFRGWFSTQTREEDRKTVIKLANKTTLRRNPDIPSTLVDYVEEETAPDLRQQIQNILNSDDEVYGEELQKLIASRSGDDRRQGARVEASPKFIQDILDFRDHVFAEMTRLSRRDGRACISCHGVPGRVPTLYLNPPDAAGYIAPAELLANYRKMQERVNLDELEESRFLRKPLDLQTPQEDGHQGGRRYEPDDAGYQIIWAWVLRQAELQKGTEIG